ESTPRGYLDRLGLGQAALRARFPSLLFARMSPFGDDGPWVDYKASDLIHLALGGPMMNSGYDPEPEMHYDLPPIAPQMWQAYHIAGEQLAINIMGALLYRRDTGHGQYLSCAIHDAVSKNTELDLQSWIMRHAPFYRQTCRHAGEAISPRSIGPTKDGRWLMTSPPGASATQGASWQKLLTLLDEHGILHDLYEEPYAQVATNRELIRDRSLPLPRAPPRAGGGGPAGSPLGAAPPPRPRRHGGRRYRGRGAPPLQKRQAFHPERHPHPRLHLVAGLGRCAALPLRPRRRGPQG